MPFTKMFRDNTNLDGLEVTIDQVLEKLKNADPTTEDHDKLTKQLKALYECKATETPSRISPDALVGVVASLVSVAAILNHERTHVITTKAFTLATRFFR
jgi:uncharacterized protein YjaG (DUF416 family)